MLPSPPPPSPILPLAPSSPITFAPPVTYPTAQHAVAITAADLHLNQAGSVDGRADVAVGEATDHPNSDASRIEVWRSAPDGTLSTYGGPYQLPAGADPRQLVNADLDGNRRPDLAVVDSGSAAAEVLRNNGDGTFDVPGASYPTDLGPDAGATGQLCSPHTNDLITASLYSSTITVLCNNGDGTLQSGQSFPAGGTQPVAVASADLNRDGAADLIVATSGTPGAINVLRNTGAVRGVNFAPAEVISAYTGKHPTALAVGDLNGDGRPDIVAANPQDGDGTISVLINTTPPNASSFSFVEHSYAVTGSQPEAVTIGDFNDDGRLDIATANYQSNDASVFGGNGDGTFQPPVRVSAGVAPVAITAADLNGDGKDDLIVANWGSRNATGSLTVALSTSRLSPTVAGARDRTRPRHGATVRQLRASIALHILPTRRTRFSKHGLVTTIAGLSARGRITAGLLGGRRARAGLPAGALDLLSVDVAGTGQAERYFFPPFSNPVILRGSMLWRSRVDHRVLACVRLGPAPLGEYGVSNVQRMTLIGGTGPAARLRLTLDAPALTFGRRGKSDAVTAAIARGPSRALPNVCRALLPKLPPN
jgi:hypothetical protein